LVNQKYYINLILIDIMGIFKKKGVDVVDLTDMQRRGILEKTAKNDNEDGVIDFGFDKTKESGANTAGDFLSSLAGVETSKSAINESPGPITDSLRDARKRASMNSELNELRLKLDDSDFKLSSLIEKVKEVERRLNERGI
jgi:hypothetical protein